MELASLPVVGAGRFDLGGEVTDAMGGAVIDDLGFPASEEDASVDRARLFGAMT